MKKTTRRILIALTLTVILVLSITGAVLAAGPYNGDCPNDGTCINDGVCPNDGICPNDCDGDQDQLQTRTRAQTCDMTGAQTRSGTCNNLQNAFGYRHGYGLATNG